MPTLPPKLKGSKRYSDNDEPERARARAISQLGKAYAEGGAYNDSDPRPAAEVFNAAKDYDTLSRVRRRVKYPDPRKK